MIKKLVIQLLASRHTWRSDAHEFSKRFRKLTPKQLRLRKAEGGFDELSELYISMFFRSMALSVIGVFVPVFLLKNGYDIQSIFLFFSLFFMSRAIMDVVGGYLIARYGPKHTMVVSYLSQIVASLLFLSLPEIGWPLLLPALFWGAANSLFFVAFHVDFSKIKHTKHGGKELGFVNIMDRIGATLGPLTGGLLAFLLSPEYIFVGAVVLLLIGLVPLFRTPEPTRTKQHLDFHNFYIDALKRDYISYAAVTIENNLTLILWPLFLALFALGTHVFLELGVITSFGVFCSVFASYYIGKMVDEKRGGRLLRVSVILNTFTHLIRPFVASFGAAAGIGVVNDVVTVGYRLPYHKGMYDAADALPGYRIVYLVSMEALGSFSKCVIWVFLYILTGVMSDYSVIVLGFLIAAVASLMILTQNFKALEYSKK